MSYEMEEMGFVILARVEAASWLGVKTSNEAASAVFPG